MALRWRTSVRDDRGRPVEPARTRSLRRLEGQEGYPASGTCSRIDYAVRHSTDESPLSLRRIVATLIWAGTAIGVFFVAIMVSGYILSLVLGNSGMTRLLALATAVIGVTCANAYRRRRAFGQVIASTLTAEGICGSCGYCLRGLTRESDGCVVCPECRAAWQEARFAEMPATAPAVHRRAPMFVLKGRGRDRRVLPDDRGRLVEFLDPGLRRLTRDRRAALGPAARSLARELRTVGRRARLICMSLLLTLAAIAAVALLWHLRPGEHVENLLAWIGLGLVVAIALGTPLTDSFAGALAIKDRILGLGRCPSCAELLDDRVSDDGCTVCHLCGAAWRCPPRDAPV